MNFFALMVSGGWLMIPIGFMSLLSTVVVIERFISLRRSGSCRRNWSRNWAVSAAVRVRSIRAKRTASVSDIRRPPPTW